VSVLLTWRRHAPMVAAALLFFGVNLGFFLWYRSTTRLRADGLQKERAALAADVASREQEARRLSAQRDRIAGVAGAIEEFYGKRIGHRRETLAPMVDEMHNVFQKVGVFPAQIAYSTTSVKSLSLTEMLVSFAYSTDYPTFKRLLAAIEGDSHWIIVRQFGLNRDASTTNTVQMRITLGTYFADEQPPGGAVRKAAAASRPRAAS